MYEPLTKQTGVAAVHQFLSQFQVQAGADGLVFATPDQNNYYGDVYIPERLRKWLLDLRLLRNIPIAYYVPDEKLLPPESIRFFYVDPTWLDRVIDGVFAAGNTGTVDAVFSYTLLAMAREALDKDLAALAAKIIPTSSWKAADGITGMLIRSELARRWPDMTVSAYNKITDPDPTTPVLRAEPISKDLWIALFAGAPAKVHLREPNVGVRFGVEVKQGGFEVDRRNDDGRQGNGNVPVPLRDLTLKTLNVASFAELIPTNEARMVALHLEQRPYVQIFKNIHPEQRGSQPLSNFLNPDGTFKAIKFRKGRFMTLESLNARMLEQQEMKINPNL
jgi:hypothetical protein